MKNVFLKALAIAALLTPGATEAQGTLYLSNLGSAPTGTQPVGSDSWLAENFITGGNPGGYLLDSIQLGMENASGSPGALRVMLYSATGLPNEALPGGSLETLAGPVSPLTAGVYTYAPPGNLILSPDTWYFMVVSADSAVAGGAYNWGQSASQVGGNGGWVPWGDILESPNGASGAAGAWSMVPQGGVAEAGIYATAIPEPGTLSLCVLGGLLLLRRRRAGPGLGAPR